MKKEYSITFKQQFFFFFSGLIKYCGLALIYIYFFGFRLQPIYIYMFLFFFIFDILPALILHLQYLHENLGSSLIINKADEKILYQKRHFVNRQSFDDIVSFELISSFGGGRFNAGWYAFGEYRYCRISFKDNSKMIITCLMINDINNTLESLFRISPKKRLKVFPFISHIGVKSNNTTKNNEFVSRVNSN